MNQLGYNVIQSKESKRMAYWLFYWTAKINDEQPWKKKIINEGKGRNNFAICT